MGSNVGCQLRSKSKTNYHQALKTQAHVDSGVVLAECILRPLAIARKSTQTDPILDPVKSPKKSLALKRLAFSKKFSIEQEAKKPVSCKLRYHCKKARKAAQVTSQVCIRTNYLIKRILAAKRLASIQQES